MYLIDLAVKFLQNVSKAVGYSLVIDVTSGTAGQSVSRNLRYTYGAANATGGAAEWTNVTDVSIELSGLTNAAVVSDVKAEWTGTNPY